MEYTSYIEKAVSDNPLLVVGSGSSIGAGISGMGDLANYLQGHILGNVGKDAEAWEKVKNFLSEGLDLESALQSVPDTSDSLTSTIVEQTWACIANDEKKPMMRISMGEDISGFVRYFKKYLHTKNKVLNIVTTNYDHIIEYSASVAGLQSWDGFNTGIVSFPISYSEFQNRLREIKLRGRNGVIRDEVCHVKIFKPHGSLSWFKMENGKFVSFSNIGYSDIPLMRENKIKPVIVTPGIAKYLETHQQPYNNVFAEMNHSILETNSVIFYGFGFNDIHIQGSFTSMLVDSSIPKIVIAKKLSTSFLKLIEDKEILNYLAIEQDGTGSKIKSDIVEDGYIEKEYWNLKGLLDIAWGDE